MSKQSREDQSGGAQATGKKAAGSSHGQSSGLKQTDNMTGAGTSKPKQVKST